MLFHASDENSEPTCTTARITSTFTSTMGPPTPTCTGCSELPAGVLPELAPAGAEVRVPGRGVAPDGAGQHDQRGQRERLGRSENVLDERAQPHAEDIHDGQKEHDHDAGKVGRVDADLHVAQHHRPHPDAAAHARCATASGWSKRWEKTRRGTCRKPRRRRRWFPSGSPGTASSRREIPTAAPATRAGRHTGRRPWASWPPVRHS